MRSLETGEPELPEPALAPSRLGALRWVHSDSALVRWRGGWWLVGASAVQLGASLRLAARGVYVFHREAVKKARRSG
jgi:hypothetical protein